MHDLGNRFGGVAWFALADEPGILREPTGVQVEWHVKATAELAGGADICHRDWLSAS